MAILSESDISALTAVDKKYALTLSYSVEEDKLLWNKKGCGSGLTLSGSDGLHENTVSGSLPQEKPDSNQTKYNSP